MLPVPGFCGCTIKNIELYSEKGEFYPNWPQYFLKITLNHDDGENKGTIVIPKVSFPIHPDPAHWNVQTEYGYDHFYPKTTIDMCGFSDFEIMPDEKGRLSYEEWSHREMTKEEIEKALGYTINIKGMRECPCKKKEGD